MTAQTGSALRGLKLFLRVVQFLCAALILAIFSYFLAALSNHALPTPTWVRAVEGISGVAVLYSLACILILWLMPRAAAAHPFTSLASMVADVAFAAAFIYVASANGGGAGSCTGHVDTPFGSGDAETGKVDQGSDGFTALPGNLGVACRLETACLAVAIVGLFFFLFSPLAEAALIRHYRKERRQGNPSPIAPEANNDDDGGGGADPSSPPNPTKPASFFSRIFRRRGKDSNDPSKNQGKMTNPNALPQHAQPDDVRSSYGTDQTRVGTATSSPCKYDSLQQQQQQYQQSYIGAGHAYDHQQHGYGHQGHLGGQHDAGIAGNGNEARWDEIPLASFPPANYRYSDGVYDRA